MPVPDHPLRKENFPRVRSDSPQVQLRAIPPCCLQGAEPGVSLPGSSAQELRLGLRALGSPGKGSGPLGTDGPRGGWSGPLWPSKASGSDMKVILAL